MAKLGVVAAATAAGVSRHTIWRYAKSGKLSSEVNAAGDRVVDTAELVRVFGELHQGATLPHPEQSNGVHHPEPQVMVATLQQRISDQEAELERLRREVAAERDERRALQERYLTIIERLQITGPTKQTPSRPRPKPEPAASRSPSVFEAVAGSVAGWLSGTRR